MGISVKEGKSRLRKYAIVINQPADKQSYQHPRQGSRTILPKRQYSPAKMAEKG